jgi:hypothetical protein
MKDRAKTMKRILLKAALVVTVWGTSRVCWADSDCVVSMLTTCSRLTANRYPDDSTNWFYPSTHPQIVFFAHLLFPLKPVESVQEGSKAEPETGTQETPAENPFRPEPGQVWHPPLMMSVPGYTPVAALSPTEEAAPLPPERQTIEVNDRHYAEAVWSGPDGQVIASFGQTLPARVSSDYLNLNGETFIPHTFAMAIGTKDLRSQAGQKALPRPRAFTASGSAWTKNWKELPFFR